MAAYLKNMPMERVFLYIFLFFGLLFMAIIPLGWNTDEPNHTYRIYQLSSGNLLSEKTIDPQTGFKAYGGEVPTELLKLYRGTGSLEPGAVGDPSKKIDKQLYVHNPELLQYADNGKRQQINFSGAALYSPVTYAIYLPFFWLGNLLSVPFFWIIMLCRLVGLTLTGLAFFFAIKHIPVGKWIFFAIGLLPTVLVQATTVGADAPQLGLTVLFVAFVTKLFFEAKKPRPFHYFVLGVLGVSLVLVKFVYAPILLLLLALLLIKNQYKNWKMVILMLLIIVASVIPGLIWTQLVSYIDINSNPQANFSAQKAFIISQPFTYVMTLYSTFFTNGHTALINIFGSFIWDSVVLPAFYAYVACAAVISSLFVKSRRELRALPRRMEYNLWRALLVVSTLTTVILIATALYIYSTTYRQSSIVGIQSRYFIPLLPLILLVFYGNAVRNQRILKASIVLMCCIALMGAVLAIYFRLYQSPSLIVALT